MVFNGCLDLRTLTFHRYLFNAVASVTLVMMHSYLKHMDTIKWFCSTVKYLKNSVIRFCSKTWILDIFENFAIILSS